MVQLECPRVIHPLLSFFEFAPQVNDGSMEIPVTDYFSDDEIALFGNSTRKSDEKASKEEEYITLTKGTKYTVMLLTTLQPCNDAAEQCNYSETPQLTHTHRRLLRASPKNNKDTSDEDEGLGFSSWQWGAFRSDTKKENNVATGSEAVDQDNEDLHHDLETEIEEMSKDKEKIVEKND